MHRVLTAFWVCCNGTGSDHTVLKARFQNKLHLGFVSAVSFLAGGNDLGTTNQVVDITPDVIITCG